MAEGTIDKQRVDVLGSSMAYVESGTGDPILFLHGNPMSSYLWRRVIPHVEHLGRCIAPDLIGMGDSARLGPDEADGYRFAVHRRFLDAFCEAVGIGDNVILVGHDWGGALAFDWARRHPEAVKGIVYGETLVDATVGHDPPERAQLVEFIRSPEGEVAVLEGDMLLDLFLTTGVLHPLPAPVVEEYRRPWAQPGENRRPLLTWVREVPFHGDPADVHEAIEAYSSWLASSEVPKLLVVSTEGQLAGSHLEFCRTWPNQREVVVPARHFFQEDAPDAVGSAIAEWVGAVT